LNESLDKCLSIFLSNDTYYNETIDYQFRGWVNGTVNNSLKFDGADDYVQPLNSALFNITGNITIEAWFYLKSNGINFILSKQYSGYGYTLVTNEQQVFFELNTTGDSKSNPLSLNKWYHTTGTWNGTHISVYINGTLENSTAYSGMLNNSEYSAVIGKWTGGSGYNFNGNLDEVRIYNRTLNDTEILWSYQRGLSGLNSNVSTTGLIGYWAFNESSGGIVSDSSGNKLTGELFNSTFNVTVINDLALGLTEELWEFIVLNNCTGGVINDFEAVFRKG